MSGKYKVTEKFKSSEKDRKASFHNKLAKVIDSTLKYQSGKEERWKPT